MRKRFFPLAMTMLLMLLLAATAAYRAAAGRPGLRISGSVVSCQQQNDDYCGPACTKMAYEALTGDYSHNQDWFANKIGTTGEGSYSGTIANKLLELTGYNYSLANMKS